MLRLNLHLLIFPHSNADTTTTVCRLLRAAYTIFASRLIMQPLEQPGQ